MRDWLVEGTDQKTGMNVSLVVQAETDVEAANEAKKKGLLVRSVREIHVDRSAIKQPDSAPQLSDGEALRQINDKMEKLLEYARPIRFWVTFIGIVVLLSLSLSLIFWIIARLQ